MESKEEYSSLHGTCCDPECGFFEQEQEEEANQLDDDVFSEDFQNSFKIRVKSTQNRICTDRSSGYVSDYNTSNSELLSPLRGNGNDVTTQTDFPPDDEPPGGAVDEVVEAPLSTNRSEVIYRDYCWRHNRYCDVESPPARPSSPCSDSKDEVEEKISYPRTGVRHKSCQICKSQLENRLQLKSRRESTRKVPVDATVARVKTCATNLLPNQLARCSELWTEERTFFLGVDTKMTPKPRPKSARQPPRYSAHGRLKQTKHAQPCLFCDNEQHVDGSPVASPRSSNACGKRSIWIRSLTFVKDKMTRSFPKAANQFTGGKRNWVLVRCVTKHPTKPLCSAEPEPKLPYREVGEQEMILCPAENRTVELIEEVCCQHYTKLSREQALESGMKVELLFSPQGPIVRDDKHLTGRSIFYFCHDGPIDRSRLCEKCEAMKNMRNFDEIPPTFAVEIPAEPSAHRRSRRRKSSAAIRGSSKLSSGSLLGKSSPLASLVGSRHRSASSVAFACKPVAARLRNRAVVLRKAAECTEKNKSKGKLGKVSRKASGKPSRIRETFTDSDDDDDDEDMKKSVTFAVREFEEETENDRPPIPEDLLKRRASLPPPPQLRARNENVGRRKRRESHQISFSETPNLKPRKKPDPPSKPTPPVAAYERPQWNHVTISVKFKTERLSCDFLEYNTLQDLYTWMRQQLLQMDLLTPGADLLLSHDNLQFPLRANTANTTIANLPVSSFQCEELNKEQKGSGFGEANSRFDTRFSIPIDVRKLTNLSPVQYVTKFCKISPTWKAFYRNTFKDSDKDRDGSISYKELEQAMERLFVELAPPLLRRVLFLLGMDPASSDMKRDIFILNDEVGQIENTSSKNVNATSWQTNLTTNVDSFISMCALANRIICREQEIDNFPVASIRQTGTELEDADFYNIEGKLASCPLDPLTKRLLLYIRNT